MIENLEVRLDQGSTSFWWSARLASHKIKDPGLHKYSEKIRIEFVSMYRRLKNLEGAIERNSFLVRTICRTKSVKNIADNHHLGLNRNFIATKTFGISLTIYFLVMSLNDPRDVSKVGSPWNLGQEVKTMYDVRLDFLPLVVI